MKRFPNLYIVGAPKCGTTSLVELLGSHPSIYAPARKEPHFFSHLAGCHPHWAERSEEDYLKAYQPGAGMPWWIDGSTWYLRGSEGVAKAILEAAPDARIIILLRDPVRRAFSSWSFAFENGWTDDRTFAASVQREGRDGDGVPWDYQHLNSSRYFEHVNRYVGLCGSHRVLVLVAEDFFRSQDAVLAKTLAWLGLSRVASTGAPKVANATGSSPAWVRGLRRKNLFGSAAKIWILLPAPIRRVAKRLLLRRRPKRELARREYDELRPQFEDDVTRLSALIGRDLNAEWNQSVTEMRP